MWGAEATSGVEVVRAKEWSGPILVGVRSCFKASIERVALSFAPAPLCAAPAPPFGSNPVVFTPSSLEGVSCFDRFKVHASRSNMFLW